jgi:hypothetical protein
LDKTHLGNQALEEGRRALVLGHVGQDTEAALGVLKIAVLDAGLDDVEGRRDDEGGRGAGDRGDKVLAPRGLVVVLELEEELLGEGGTAEELVRGRKLVDGVFDKIGALAL